MDRESRLIAASRRRFGVRRVAVSAVLIPVVLIGGWFLEIWFQHYREQQAVARLAVAAHTVEYVSICPRWLGKWIGHAKCFKRVVGVTGCNLNLDEEQFETLRQHGAIEVLDEQHGLPLDELDGSPLPFEMSDVSNMVSLDAGLAELVESSSLDEISDLVGEPQPDVPPRQELRIFSRLRKLDLSNTSVNDAWLRQICEFRNIDCLNLALTTVSDSGVKNLCCLPHLRELNLDGTQVTDASLSHIKNIKSLRVLTLDGTQVSTSGVWRHLREMSRLEVLSLNNTRIDDAALPYIGRLTNLEDVGLRRTKIGDEGISHLANLQKLRSLDLGDTEISDACLTHVVGLALLRELMLDNTQVSDAGVEFLRQLPGLEVLNVFGSQVSDADEASKGVYGSWLEEMLQLSTSRTSQFRSVRRTAK